MVLDLDVAFERVGTAEEVGDDGVVDHQVGRRQWIHLAGVAAKIADGLAHRREVDDARHAGEVLHDHPRRCELNFDARVGLRIPLRDGADVIGGDVGAVLGAKQVLGQDFQAVREFLGAVDGVEAVDLIALVADLQGVAG